MDKRAYVEARSAGHRTAKRLFMDLFSYRQSQMIRFRNVFLFSLFALPYIWHWKLNEVIVSQNVHMKNTNRQLITTERSKPNGAPAEFQLNVNVDSES